MRRSPWHPALAVALVAAGVVTACETVPYGSAWPNTTNPAEPPFSKMR